MTLCACGHDVDAGHLPAGPCTETLPRVDADELPAWRCPCRRAVASGVTTLLLRSVQSCTVHAAVQAPDQDISPRAAEAILELMALDRELRGA